MANITGKRKREDIRQTTKPKKKTSFAPAADQGKNNAKPKTALKTKPTLTDGLETTTPLTTVADTPSNRLTVQIVTGSYDRILHGIAATLPAGADDAVAFSDTFLFAAHSSAIRCLAVSPLSGPGKRLLATGSSDERINVYSISTAPPTATNAAPAAANPNPRNRSLGTLIHHDRAVTCLDFPSRGKLFSGAEDSTLAIARARDWTVLSTIKAPIPKPQGRPSGDTALPGEVPAGLNGFAVHPSQKLMLTVGRRERCMRLWNLMTAKKAGVLNFDRDLLAQVGEGKFASGEGRRVLWDAAGDKFVVGFERGAAVFGIDSQPKAIIKPAPSTKLHQMRFLPQLASHTKASDVLAVSTEDGRILFFRVELPSDDELDAKKLPLSHCVAQLGGIQAGIGGRIKDFDVLLLPQSASATPPSYLVVTGSSDGAVRLWSVSADELSSTSATKMDEASSAKPNTKTNGSLEVPVQVGSLLGLLETDNRITCLSTFIMDGEPEAGNAEIEEEEPIDAESSDDDEE